MKRGPAAMRIGGLPIGRTVTRFFSRVVLRTHPRIQTFTIKEIAAACLLACLQVVWLLIRESYEIWLGPRRVCALWPWLKAAKPGHGHVWARDTINAGYRSLTAYSTCSRNPPAWRLFSEESASSIVNGQIRLATSRDLNPAARMGSWESGPSSDPQSW